MCDIDKARADAEMAKMLYRNGKMARSEAVKAVAPYKKIFNEKSAEIAKKYGQRPKLFSFASYMR